MRRVWLVLVLFGLATAFARAVITGPGGVAPAPGAALELIEVTALVAPDDVAVYLEGLGAVIELRSHDRIQALVPASQLPALRSARSLLRIERPAILVALDLPPPSELIGAGRWQAAGFTGHGVSVAVLDAGFEGYEDLLGTSLPERVATRSFRASGDLGSGTDHGTRSAEVVHRIAPGADLYLLNFGTITELSAAVDFIAAQGIDIVSFSLGFIHSGPGDGTGPVDDVVTRDAEDGAIWAVAAGNWAQQHWAGQFVDADGDSIHEFEPGTSGAGRVFQEGDLIIVSLRWEDEWGAACSDYDLELFGPDGSLVRASRQIQDCSGDPVESLQVLATQDGEYSVRIVKASADEPRKLDLMVVGSPGRGESLSLFVEAGSLSEPADHASVVTVGAVSGVEPLAVEPFSSRGPTVDGRAKPEVVSPTGIAGALAGGEAFAGTSAAAPHVAGVAALLREALPNADAAVIRAQLAERAIDLSADGGGAPLNLLANLGSLAGLGLLLPVGAEEARLSGDLPPGEGLALLVYTGPDGYPLRFARLLLDGRGPLAWFRFDVEEQRWDRYIIDAPAAVNSFELVQDGDVLVARIAAPAGVEEAAGSSREQGDKDR